MIAVCLIISHLRLMISASIWSMLAAAVRFILSCIARYCWSSTPAASLADTANEPVAPVMRRIPFATAVSSTTCHTYIHTYKHTHTNNELNDDEMTLQ